MSVNIRYPNITALTEKEQITQIKSYLHQLVEQLNYALPNIGSGSSSAQTAEVQGEQLSYYELRSLIIQEIQQIETMFDQLSKRMESGYVKASGWGSDKYLVTNTNGNVVAGKLTFTLDEDGNLYYEVEE